VASTTERIKNIIDIGADQKTLSFKEECLEVLADHKNSNLIATGFTKLDELISGFRPGQFIVIGAATSMGKSAFAVNLALNICDQSQKVALWSFEMDKKEIIHRVFAIRTGLSSNTLKNDTMTEEYYNTVRRYADSTQDDLLIRVDRVRNMNDFYLECRVLRNRGVAVVMIDYLQLINLDQGFGANRVRELEQITNNLKIIATELGITIIALSQLSREVHKRDGKRPILSDLRDSGSIEQDADIVMFLHRPDFVLIQQGRTFDEIPREVRNTADVIVAKNRDGQTGTCSLKFDRNLTKFSN
jgi:replicative DNA helicase